MELFEKIVNIIYKVFLSLLVAFLLGAGSYYGYIGIKNVYNILQDAKNQEGQVNEIYDNQVFLIGLLMDFINRQGSFNKAIVNDLLNINKKPTYNYLSSVTVYLFNPFETKQEGKKWKGIIGTGVIVAQKEGYNYILTNRHICNYETINKCYVVDGLNSSQWIVLDYIKETQSKYDLALWRTRSELPTKRAIKGLAIAYPQNSVYSVGHYLTYPFIYTEGTYAGLEEDFGVYNLPCSGGCSGSGIFNKDGYLVGLVFGSNVIFNSGLFSVQTDTSKVLAINSDVIRLFLGNLLDY